MRAYDNNNYYGYNNNSMTPSGSSSGSRISHYGGGSGSGGGQEYMSNVSSTPQSSDAELDYHALPTSRTLRSENISTTNQRLSSGSFTVIGSKKKNNNNDNQNELINYPTKVNIRLPEPEAAPHQHRVKQSKRSHRNTSFSIMTELPPNSRTPSPPIVSNSTSGRVSPFRGRGFRPGASSRHTTPSTSPPPPILPSDSNNNNNNNNISGMNSQPYYEDQTTIRNVNYINNTSNDITVESNTHHRQQSRIPRANRQQNELGEKGLLHPNQQNSSFVNQTSNNNNMLNNNNLSRSLSNLTVKQTISRPPPSPRRNTIKQPFSQLSPIIGTPKMSPETNTQPSKSILKPSKSAFVLLSKDDTSSDDSKLKSPSKIPRSTSLNRLSKSTESLSNNEPTSRETSRNHSPRKKSQTRLNSREPSPSLKPPTGPRRTMNRNTSSIIAANKAEITGPNAKSNISRTSSMKNLSKPKSLAPGRSTSPSNQSRSPNRSSRLTNKSINKGTSSLTPSRSTSPSTNPISRGPSPNRSSTLKTKSTTKTSNSLHPSRSTSPSNNMSSRGPSPNRTSKLTTKPISRGPSPNRLGIPREKIGTRSRDPSPNKNKNTTPKSPTRIPIKSNNSYRNVVSKIDSNNKRGNNTSNKPKIPPKPGVDTDSNHKSKNREPKLSRQMSRDKNIAKPNKPLNDKSKLLKSSSSKKLINLPGNNNTSNINTNNTLPSSKPENVVNENKVERNEENTTTTETSKIEKTEEDENENTIENKPTPTLATLIAQNFDSNANNVVSVTTETATAPLHIEAPKPQIPVARIENLLTKPVAEKSSISDTKSNTSTTAAMNQNKTNTTTKTDTVPSTENRSPPKPKKNPQVSSTGLPMKTSDNTNNPSSTSDTLKQNEVKKDEINNENTTKPENKVLTKKNSEKNISNNTSNKNNNTTIITHSNSTEKNSIPSSNNSLQTIVNNNTQNKSIIVSDKVKPIQIQVKEKGTNLDVQSGNVERRPSNGTITGNAEPRLPSSNITQAADSTTEGNNETNKKSLCGRIFSCCKSPTCCARCRKTPSNGDSTSSTPKTSPGCFSCCRKASHDESVESRPIVADRQRLSDVSDESRGRTSTNSDQRTCCMKFKDVLCCSRKNKVSDLSSRPKGCCGSLWCCRRKSNEENWAERRDSILSDAPPRKCCPVSCWPFCRRKSEDSGTEPDSRRTSMLDKKKSLSPSTVQPAEKKKPALDESLVEHTSEMRGAIPVLPVPLAWICLILNCILPGVGTILSGIFCLCFGKPRFSVHDGARPRLGSFIINLIVGVAQLFCVLFCLVGWGWSIWWGVIMLKVARKHKRIKATEVENPEELEQVPTATNVNHNGPDVERGRS